MSDTVAVEDLRVGMFVHLDLGWMAHPFALSSFRIESEDEIARIRALGLKRLRWSRERSRLAQVQDAVPVAAPGEDPARSAAEAAERQRREALARQRAAAQRCQAQFDEASTALRDVISAVRDRPGQAREAAESLAQSLLDKLDPDAEVCVLALSGAAGERSTAHALNVSVISMLLGRVFAFPAAEMRDLLVGALLHDIGKLDLPARLHHHEERFTQAELNAYRDHVRLGVAHGRRMGLSDAAVSVIEQHHENADGTGYPQRLIMDRMSTPARIVSMVNRYDNLCNPRLPGRALTPHEALSTLFAQASGKFDGTMLTAFIRMMGVYPAGSVVQLTDDRYAIVTHVNASRPLKPRVLVHDERIPREDALLINLLDTPDLGIRRSLTPSQLPSAARAYLDPSPKVAYFFEPVHVQPETAWA